MPRANSPSAEGDRGGFELRRWERRPFRRPAQIQIRCRKRCSYRVPLLRCDELSAVEWLAAAMPAEAAPFGIAGHCKPEWEMRAGFRAAPSQPACSQHAQTPCVGSSRKFPHELARWKGTSQLKMRKRRPRWAVVDSKSATGRTCAGNGRTGWRSVKACFPRG